MANASGEEANEPPVVVAAAAVAAAVAAGVAGAAAGSFAADDEASGGSVYPLMEVPSSTSLGPLAGINTSRLVADVAVVTHHGFLVAVAAAVAAAVDDAEPVTKRPQESPERLALQHSPPWGAHMAAAVQ